MQNKKKLFLAGGAKTLDQYLYQRASAHVKRLASAVTVLDWKTQSPNGKREIDMFAIPVLADTTRMVAATAKLLESYGDYRLFMGDKLCTESELVDEMAREMRWGRQFGWKLKSGDLTRQFKTAFGKEIYSLMPKSSELEGRPTENNQPYGLMQLIGNIPGKVFDGELSIPEVEYFREVSSGEYLFLK